MYFKDIAYLMKETISLNELRKPNKSYVEEKIFVNEKSITQTEFYQAQSVGLKPSIKLEAKLINIDNTSHIKFKNIVYKIERFYKKEDIIELILTKAIIK